MDHSLTAGKSRIRWRGPGEGAADERIDGYENVRIRYFYKRLRGSIHGTE